MELPKKCLQCGSSNVEYVEFMGSRYLKCKDCQYDQTKEYDEAYPTDRSSQKEKGRFSPYKQGGSSRTKNI